MKKLTMKSIIKSLLLVVTFIFLLVACQGNSGSNTDKGKKEKVTVTDVIGNEFQLELPLDKVIVNWSGSGGAFMTMSALLGEDVVNHIAGWGNSLPTYRMDMYQHYSSKVPGLDKIENVGSVDTDNFNVEKVIELNPDACIFALGTKEAADSSVKEKLEKAGIPILYIDYHKGTLENHEKSTLLLGQLFNKEERAQEIVNFCLTKKKDIEERAKKIANKRSLYLEAGMEGPTAYGNTWPNNNMWGRMADLAGARNIAGDMKTKSGPIDPEFLISSNPDVMIITGSYWPNKLDSLRMGYGVDESVSQKLLTKFINTRQGWKQLKAVENKEVYAIHHGIGREVFDFAATEFIAKSLYPEEFKDLDPLGDLKEYYEKFLPYDLEGTWMIKWKPE